MKRDVEIEFHKSQLSTNAIITTNTNGRDGPGQDGVGYGHLVLVAVGGTYMARHDHSDLPLRCWLLVAETLPTH